MGVLGLVGRKCATDSGSCRFIGIAMGFVDGRARSRDSDVVGKKTWSMGGDANPSDSSDSDDERSGMSGGTAAGAPPTAL